MLKNAGINTHDKVVTRILLSVGVVCAILGIILVLTKGDGHGLSTIAGIMTGMGVSMVFYGIKSIVKQKKLTPQERRQLEIEAKDERNQLIARKAFTVSALMGIIVCFVVGMIFFALDNVIVGYTFIGCMLVQTFTIVVARAIYNKRD